MLPAMTCPLPALTQMPSPTLPESTLPRIVAFVETRSWMASSPLPWSVSPSASRPTMLPRTTVPAAPLIQIPLLALPEITFASAATAPPIVLFAPSTSTPWVSLASVAAAAAPLSSIAPIQFPATTLPSEPAWIRMPALPKSRMMKPRTVLPSAVPVSVRPLPARPAPSRRMRGVVPAPSCVVASRTTASLIAVSDEPASVIVCAPPPPAKLIEKFDVWMPVIAFEFRMNWRSEPCCRRGVAPPSSSAVSPRVFTIALNEKPESMPVASAPAIATRATCSAAVSVAALSETAAFRPP